MKKHIFKKWSLCFLTGIVFLTLGVAFINWLVDPLCSFHHAPLLAQQRSIFNDRQQKTNYLFFHRPRIKTVIIGSSRMMFTDPTLWDLSGFNYSLVGLAPVEYSILASQIRELNLPVNTFILALDFFSASLRHDIEFAEHIVATNNALSEAQKPNYRFTSLLDWKAFKYSLRSIFKNYTTQNTPAPLMHYHDGYFSGHLTFIYPEDQKKRLLLTNEHIKTYHHRYSNFQYNPDFKQHLASFNKIIGEATLIPIITPVGTPFLRMIAQTPGLLENYERWIRDIVSQFTEAWCFMDVNSVTRNPLLWMEPSHHGPEVSQWIVERIEQRGAPPKDFGIHVTLENLDNYITCTRKAIEQLVFEKDGWDLLLTSR